MKPCPWCGLQVKKPTASIHNITDRKKHWHVRFWHDAMLCPIRLDLIVRVSGKTEEEAIERAITIWNTWGIAKVRAL